MARKERPTDLAEIQLAIEEAIQDLVRKGLVVELRSEEMVSTNWALCNRVGAYGLRQGVPLKGTHKSQ